MYYYKSNQMWKTFLLKNLFLNTFNEFEKIYIYSLSLHQDLNQKFIKFSSD